MPVIAGLEQVQRAPAGDPASWWSGVDRAVGAVAGQRLAAFHRRGPDRHFFRLEAMQVHGESRQAVSSRRPANRVFLRVAFIRRSHVLWVYIQRPAQAAAMALGHRVQLWQQLIQKACSACRCGASSTSWARSRLASLTISAGAGPEISTCALRGSASPRLGEKAVACSRLGLSARSKA